MGMHACIQSHAKVTIDSAIPKYIKQYAHLPHSPFIPLGCYNKFPYLWSDVGTTFVVPRIVPLPSHNKAIFEILTLTIATYMPMLEVRLHSLQCNSSIV